MNICHFMTCSFSHNNLLMWSVIIQNTTIILHDYCNVVLKKLVVKVVVPLEKTIFSGVSISK